MTTTTVFGMTPAMKTSLLSVLLPGGTDRYLGLWETFPTQRDGTGGVEASFGTYSRVAHQSWTNSTEDDRVYRTNSGIIAFAAQAEEVTMEGWGVWDSLTVGTLLYIGHFRTTNGVIVPEIVAPAGDNFEWGNGRLRIGLQ